MPNWKKVLVSGSNATLNHITASGNISSSGYISASFFSGDGSQLKNLPSSGGSIFETGSAPQITPSIQPIAGLNTASGNFSSVLGGKKNESISNASSIVGGYYNYITKSAYSSIAGGSNNSICISQFGGSNTIVGGNDNYMHGSSLRSNTINGGYYNYIKSTSYTTSYTTIAGGSYNGIDNTGGTTLSHATVGGGYCNRIYKNSGASTIAGGFDSCISSSQRATIAGGAMSFIHNSRESTIGGGCENLINNNNFIPGEGQTSVGKASTIAGGKCNAITNVYSFIGGGKQNETSGSHSNVVGGFQNKIVDGRFSTDGGETFQALQANFSSIVGGMYNQVLSPVSSIMGGCNNQIKNSCCSTIGGGISNCINTDGIGSYYGHLNTISGGGNNLISGSGDSHIAGGKNNKICIKEGLSNTIHGGHGNCIIGGCSTYSNIAGGGNNSIEASYCDFGYLGTYNASILSGYNNHIISQDEYINHSIIVGGASNNIKGDSAFSVIVGGSFSEISSSRGSIVAGGKGNDIISSSYGIVGGGYGNVINSENLRGLEQTYSNSHVSAILGGYQNAVTNAYSSIGGGKQNIVSGSFSNIGGGCNNVISGSNLESGNYGCFQTIAGGENNKILGNSAHNFIGNGKNNIIFHYNDNTGASSYSNIVGGENNKIETSGDGTHHSIVGGRGNCIEGSNYAVFIGGGVGNRIAGGDSSKTIVGGEYNYNSGRYATIAGGSSNCVTGYHSTLVGGYGNITKGGSDTVSGGKYNETNGSYSTIGGGYCNIIAINNANRCSNTIVGGESNHIIGEGSILGDHDGNSILGGCYNNVSASALPEGTMDVCNNIIGGRNNKIHNAQDSGILGGKSNCITHNNSFTIGSDICSTRTDTLFVNNICLYGSNGSNGQILGGANIVLEEGTFGTATTVINDNISSSGYLKMEGAITASTDISSSGTITGNSFIKGGGTSAQFLKADGSVDSSTYLTSVGTINLTSEVTGILPVPNGGTGVNTVTSGRILIGNGTSALTTDSGFTYSQNTLTAATASVKLLKNNSGGNFIIDGNGDDIYITSFLTAQEGIDIPTGFNLNVQDLTSGNVVIVGSGGGLADTTDFTYNTSNKLLSAPTASFDHLIVSQVISSSVINTSGSNIFGDEATDTQTLNGSVILGNITDSTETKALFIDSSNTIKKRTLQANAFTSTTIPVIASTSVTDLSDVTSAGSGIIITAAERTAIGTNTTDISTNTSDISTNTGNISTNTSGISSNTSAISGKAASGANSDITSLSGLTTALSVAQGGTGATTLGAFLMADNDLSELNDPQTARDNLELGSMAVQTNTSVNIDGGSITGITDLAVADGGTGAGTASGARSNLGAAKSGANTDITSLTGLTTALSVAQGGTGTTTLDEIPLSSFDDDLNSTYVELTNAQTISGTKTFSVAQKFSTGTVSVPSISFNSNNVYTTGFYLSNPNEISISRAGVQTFKFDSNGLQSLQSGTSNFSGDVIISSHLQSHCLGVGTTASTTQGEIRATGDIIANYSSDKRLKENIKPISGALDKLLQMSGVTFDWIEKEEVHSHKGHDVGVIAQEVEAVLPEVVVTRDNGYKAVNYEKIVPLLIESIKDLKAEIDELKKSK